MERNKSKTSESNDSDVLFIITRTLLTTAVTATATTEETETTAATTATEEATKTAAATTTAATTTTVMVAVEIFVKVSIDVLFYASVTILFNLVFFFTIFTTTRHTSTSSLLVTIFYECRLDMTGLTIGENSLFSGAEKWRMPLSSHQVVGKSVGKKNSGSHSLKELMRTTIFFSMPDEPR
ncbi:hypothetical protein [Brevibacillus porteri]|uniref:hypothetical protein n=1 Tax=Brevibacillus porteri TaxID=2126350 RepID=UPI003640343E